MLHLRTPDAKNEVPAEKSDYVAAQYERRIAGCGVVWHWWALGYNHVGEARRSGWHRL